MRILPHFFREVYAKLRATWPLYFAAVVGSAVLIYSGMAHASASIIGAIVVALAILLGSRVLRYRKGTQMPRTLRVLKTTLTYLLFGGVVALAWASAWHVMASAPEVKGLHGEALSTADRATIVFGAATVALILVSLLVGTIALYEWQKLDETIRRAVEKSIVELETATEGRIESVIGFALGELSSEPDRLEATNRDRLSESVRHCQRGYDMLKSVGKRGQILMALNNLVYYSSIYGDRSKASYLLRKARVLRDAGSEFGDQTLLLTYCRAVLTYATDPSEISEAHEIANSLLHSTLTDNQKREARFYVEALADRMGRYVSDRLGQASG